MDVDTTYMAEFVKGLNEGANAGDNKKKAAYYAGIQIGQQIANRMVKGINFQVFGDDSTKTISLKNFMAGFVAATTGKKGLMTVDSAQVLAERLMRDIKAKQMEKTYGPNKEAGEKFLAENAKKEGVKTLHLPCEERHQGLDGDPLPHACWFRVGGLHSPGAGLWRA